MNPYIYAYIYTPCWIYSERLSSGPALTSLAESSSYPASPKRIHTHQESYLPRHLPQRRQLLLRQQWIHCRCCCRFRDCRIPGVGPGRMKTKMIDPYCMIILSALIISIRQCRQQTHRLRQHETLLLIQENRSHEHLIHFVLSRQTLCAHTLVSHHVFPQRAAYSPDDGAVQGVGEKHGDKSGGTFSVLRTADLAAGQCVLLLISFIHTHTHKYQNYFHTQTYTQTIQTTYSSSSSSIAANSISRSLDSELPPSPAACSGT
jgi:hypothetical protein